MFSKNFGKGGIHPNDHKQLTKNNKIENADIPNVAYIPIIQHNGSPAKIVVKIGQKVDEGELIAEATGFISANVHSSIPGIVSEIKEVFISTGIKSQVVVIQLGGEFKKSGKNIELKDWRSLGKKEILKTIKEYGIVGLGGGAFPTHVKLNIPDGKTLETLIVNGAECEPYLTTDHRLMLDYSEDLLEGISILEYLFDLKKIYIGIEVNKKDAIRRLRELSQGKYNVKIVPIRAKYPQGDEKLLIRTILKKTIPADKLPLDFNSLVLNVSTVIAIKEAIINDKPMIDRVVTVTGNGISIPKNLKVKIGTPIDEVLDECGGIKPNVKKVIVGGPMMGFAQMDLKSPITKLSSCIILLNSDDYEEYNNDGVCINCGRCVSGCAYGLMPAVINKYIKYKKFSDALDTGLMYCKECGACSWSCPARIPLVQNLRMAKDIVKKLKLI